jgi:hypothetical protein
VTGIAGPAVLPETRGLTWIGISTYREEYPGAPLLGTGAVKGKLPRLLGIACAAFAEDRFDRERESPVDDHKSFCKSGSIEVTAG